MFMCAGSLCNCAFTCVLCNCPDRVQTIKCLGNETMLTNHGMLNDGLWTTKKQQHLNKRQLSMQFETNVKFAINAITICLMQNKSIYIGIFHFVAWACRANICDERGDKNSKMSHMEAIKAIQCLVVLIKILKKSKSYLFQWFWNVHFCIKDLF